MIERVEWEQLPAGLRVSVEVRTGAVVAAELVPQGLNCTVALALTTQRGPLFFKGVREDDTEGVAALRWEEQLNPTVRGVSPTIRHTFRSDGWYCAAFDYIEGRNADLGPGSADLDTVALTLHRMHQLRLPDLTIPPLADRFSGHLLPGEEQALAGGHLLHTDTNPHNIMISGGNAYVVDWAMPAVGPAWVDAAYTAVRLMEYGQSPATALAWLNTIPSWRRADPKAVAAFTSATCRRWTATVGEKSAAASNTRIQHLTA
ncbi:phosphotransferase [Streptomyces sp. NBC_01506]|uniref:phosphotransferase n=1 Tax=Streptomyces sp. NBC_01506 TaxID=2903887 RepID=UPI0038658DC1